LKCSACMNIKWAANKEEKKKEADYKEQFYLFE
jgi:hypothetical protein